MTVNVLLKTTKEVAALTAAALMMPVGIKAVSGSYSVDAKSILGLLSLNLSKPIALEWSSDVDSAKQDVFLESINPFVAEADAYEKMAENIRLMAV